MLTDLGSNLASSSSSLDPLSELKLEREDTDPDDDTAIIGNISELLIIIH